MDTDAVKASSVKARKRDRRISGILPACKPEKIREMCGGQLIWSDASDVLTSSVKLKTASRPVVISSDQTESLTEQIRNRRPLSVIFFLRRRSCAMLDELTYVTPRMSRMTSGTCRTLDSSSRACSASRSSENDGSSLSSAITMVLDQSFRGMARREVRALTAYHNPGDACIGLAPPSAAETVDSAAAGRLFLGAGFRDASGGDELVAFLEVHQAHA